MGYVTGRWNKPFEVLLERAVRKGVAHSGNRRVQFDGKIRRIWSFNGHVVAEATGVLRCEHFNTEVFAYDFQNHTVTDFGYTGYSLSTSRNIDGWSRIVGEMVEALTKDSKPIRFSYVFQTWCRTRPKREIGEGKQSLLEKFRERVPWCFKDMYGYWWFDIQKYNGRVAEQFRATCEVLRKDQNWRYLTYDWNAEGDWVAHFIDDEAKKRWYARIRRRKQTGWGIDGDLQRNLPVVLGATVGTRR